MQEELQATGRKPENKTLRDIWEEWKELKNGNLAPGTMNRYRQIVASLPFIDCPIRTISFATIQGYMNENKDKCKSTNSVTKALLSNLFKYAKKAGYILNNPAADVEVIGKAAKELPEPLTLDDIEKICDALDDMNLKKQSRIEYKGVLWVGYYTGLRLGEIMALEIEDIDFQNKTLSVNKKMELHDGKPYITNRLKTKASNAVIPLCDACIDFLDAYTKNLDRETLFTVSFHTVELRLKVAAQKAGIEGFHPHMLRHSFVTNVVQSGTDPKTAAQLARHSSVKTTLDIYTQTSQETMRNAVNETYKNPKKDPEIQKILA